MFWIFLLLIIAMAFGCYVTYKEAKHHELHKLRAEFSDLYKKHQILVEETEKNDPEMLEYFKGELIGIDESFDIIKNEEKDYDTIQEIEDDIKKIKEKIAGLFKKKDGEVA